MSESNKPFVVTDRRKFTTEGDLRPDVAQAQTEQKESRTAPPEEPQQVTPDVPAPEYTADDSIPAPTPEQVEQSRFAYEQTADRLDTAIRSANPGGDYPPAMNFDQLVQSIYLTAIMQLGGATAEGQKPQVDILGARQSIDMLGVLVEKTKGNLDAQESKLLESARFELQMAFLEITQAFARSAAAKSGGAPKPGLVL